MKVDVIFHDDLIDQDFWVNIKGRKFMWQGKHCHSHEQEEINQLILNSALEGNEVVRLKGAIP